MLLVAGPPAGAAGRTPADPTTYRRPLGNEPATLDPARINDVYSRSVAQQIFDGLVQFDHTLTITPALARFWKASRDGLVWTFTLRHDVKFHHGRTVTADDVVFSLTRLLDPKLKSASPDLLMPIKGAPEFREGRAKAVSGLVALDDRTVQVTLSESWVPLPSMLAVGSAKIVPRDLVERDGEGFGLRPVGTGPFRFVRWERAKEIVLDANPEYFQGAPALARLVFRVFPGEQFEAIYDEFQRGRLEDAPVPSIDYRRVVADPRHRYVRRPMFNVRYYGLNTRVKPFDDRRIRQALAHAIDRDAIMEEIWQGRYVTAKGVLPPGTLGFNPKLIGHAFDPARARELLTQAGYPGGAGLPVIQIWSSVNEQLVLREHARIKRWLEQIGLRVEFRYLTDWPAFTKGFAEGRYPAFLSAWFADVPDPDNFLFKLFHSQSPRNVFGYKNPVVDDLLMRARSESDSTRRVELYRRVEQLVVDDAPMLPVWHSTYERLFQPYVRSVEVNGLGDPYIPLRKIWLERPGEGGR
jgi:peptide/nickel transport system substrate-binding protein/oligopeptide transport system substrate-binding protein